ncbi:MAG: hypothetical protein RLZZ385_2540 [Pseudomonadota bacterium]|jgi:two-component system sensor histidine kinase KdpD
MLKSREYRYLLAMVLPLLVTGLAQLLSGLQTPATVPLAFLVAVVMTAVNAGVRPAVLTAILSFLCLNFFFTEPRGTLQVHLQADLITLGLFLLVALFVGHLAARLREQLGWLQDRERIAGVEARFTEKLAVATSPQDVVKALHDALQQMGVVSFLLLPVAEGRVEIPQKQGRLTERQHRFLRERTESLSLQDEVVAGEELELYLLHDRHELFAALVSIPAGEGAGDSHVLSLLCRQANMALGRTRLMRDLQRERLDKEQEIMRSSLLSSVSHDFRTPLTAMVGATSTLLEMGEELPREQRVELLQSVLDEASRLNSYTQNLLDMTRLGRGELTLNRVAVSVAEILNVVVRRARKLDEQRQIVLQVDDSLPLLNVHPALVEQAIYNVLENAMKFSPPEEPISIVVQESANRVIIDVIDRGPGIPVAEREKVFEMFHAADRGDRRQAGSGLGLAICKGMIGAHGGAVSIQDGDEGKGCRVRIELPCPPVETTNP